jgi:hypothetical protein
MDEIQGQAVELLACEADVRVGNRRAYVRTKLVRHGVRASQMDRKNSGLGRVGKFKREGRRGPAEVVQAAATAPDRQLVVVAANERRCHRRADRVL